MKQAGTYIGQYLYRKLPPGRWCEYTEREGESRGGRGKGREGEGQIFTTKRIEAKAHCEWYLILFGDLKIFEFPFTFTCLIRPDQSQIHIFLISPSSFSFE